MEQITEEIIDRLQLSDAIDLCKKLGIDSAVCTCLSEVRNLLKKDLKRRTKANKSQQQASFHSDSTSQQTQSAAALQASLPSGSSSTWSTAPLTLPQGASPMTSLSSNPPQESDDSYMYGCDEVTEPLEKDFEKQKAMKRLLLEMYEKTSRLFDPECMMDGLKEISAQTNDNYAEKVASNLRKLKSEECPIVITGETSSGKSTLINLLIGDELLPYSVLHKTAALCCLRYSEEKYLVYEDSGGAREFHFEKNVSTEDVNNKLDKLMEDAKVKSVDIFWPLPLLRNKVNVMLVDTPGLGENDELVDILMKYLPKAVGFIYVINSANAGGIEKNKILRILAKQISLEKEGETVFDIASTIFVCNKWDQVPNKEDEQVMKFIQNKLEECMKLANKTINMDKQVLRFSAAQAILALKSGVSRTADFETLLQAIKVLVPKCLERKYVQLYRWLRQFVLEPIYQTACTHLMFAWTPVAERQKLQADVEKRLKQLSKKCEKVYGNMQKEGNRFCTNTAKKLSEYLHSKEVKQRLCTWDESKAPPSRCEKLAEELENAVMEKIRTEIVYWQTNERDFQSDLTTFKTKCSNMCESLEKDIEDVRFMLEGAGQIVDLPQTRQRKHEYMFDMFEHMEVGGKVAAFITAPIWVPIFLVVGMIGLPIMGMGSLIKTLAKDAKTAFDNRLLRNTYEKDKSNFLEKFTNNFLNENITTDYIKKFIFETYYGDYLRAIDYWFHTFIPRQFETNRRFLKSIVREGDTTNIIQIKYAPVKQLFRSFLARMTLFRLNYLEEASINESNIEFMGTVWSGHYRQVQEVHYRAGNQSSMGAALVSFPLNDCIKLQEIECLLNLDHNRIVRTLGVVHNCTGDTVKTEGVLMELCQGTAEAMFLQVPGNACSKYIDLHTPEAKKAFILFLDISIGACSALKYVHESGYLHGNLKLSKILISPMLEPRLTGMGSIRHEGVSTNKSMSGLSHFAPEVLIGKPYRGSSDVYSFGIALWEMWFGRRVFPEGELDNQTPIAFAGKQFAGYHPGTNNEKIHPDKLWKAMQASLECEFGKRPTVANVLNILEDMHSSNVHANETS